MSSWASVSGVLSARRGCTDSASSLEVQLFPLLEGLSLLLDAPWGMSWSLQRLAADLGAYKLSADAELLDIEPVVMLASAETA